MNAEQLFLAIGMVGDDLLVCCDNDYPKKKTFHNLYVHKKMAARWIVGLAICACFLGIRYGLRDNSIQIVNTEEISVQITKTLPEGFCGQVLGDGESDFLSVDDEVEVNISGATEIIQPDGSYFDYNKMVSDGEEWPYKTGSILLVEYNKYSLGDEVVIYAKHIESLMGDLVYEDYGGGFDISLGDNEVGFVKWTGDGIIDKEKIDAIYMYSVQGNFSEEITESFLGYRSIRIMQSGHYFVFAVFKGGERQDLADYISIQVENQLTSGNIKNRILFSI